MRSHFSGEGLECWGARCEFQTLCSSGGSSELCDPCSCRIYREIISQPLLLVSCVGFFTFTKCVRIAQLVWGFFSEEIVLYVAVDSGCSWEMVSSRSLYVSILNHNSLFVLFLSTKPKTQQAFNQSLLNE